MLVCILFHDNRTHFARINLDFGVKTTTKTSKDDSVSKFVNMNLKTKYKKMH